MKLDEKAQGRAKDFQALKNMNAWAWLASEIEAEKTNSLAGLDTAAIDSFTVAKLAQDRGYRKGLQFVLDTVNRRAEIG